MTPKKYTLLCKTSIVKCPCCGKRREVIQRYKAMKQVDCDDCKRLKNNKRARENHAKHKLKQRTATKIS